MPEHPRIEDLRRRIQKDPASIAFAQLAEEYRRAGQYEESVDVCRAGLNLHPTYLSARVTLGRALIELNRLDDARTELQTVLRSAPENLAAIRGVAEIHQRQGTLAEALDWFKTALALAPNDPELEQTVEDLSRKVAPAPRIEAADALSFDEMRRELQAPADPAVPDLPLADEVAAGDNPDAMPVADLDSDPERVHAERTIGALEQWLDAIHGARAHRGA